MENKKFKKFQKNMKKVLDKWGIVCYYIGALEARTSKVKESSKKLQKKLKKYLTKTKTCVKMLGLSREALRNAEAQRCTL
jgi:hypothetical protein